MLPSLLCNSLGLGFLSGIRDYAIYITDTDGHVLFWNRGAAELFGWSEIEVTFFTGSIAWEESRLFTSEDRARGECDRERMQAVKNGLLTNERWYTRRDGSRFLGSGTLLPLHDVTDSGQNNGAVRWFLRMLCDATQQDRQWKRLEADLDSQHRAADKLQASQLPDLSNFNFPGLSLAALYLPIRPEERVGGDFYDAMRLEDGSITLFVGDATGKGLAAATRATEVRHGLRAFLWEDPSPERAVSRVNRMLCRCSELEQRPGGMFTTLTLVKISPDRQHVECVHAGGEFPLLLRADGSPLLESSSHNGGMALGIDGNQPYSSTIVSVKQGDLLLLFTDGVTECRKDGKFFGPEGIINTMRSIQSSRGNHSTNIHAIAEEVLQQAIQFGGNKTTDDMCLLLAQLSS